MNIERQISRLRLLLENYYDGNVTPSEMREIYSLFDSIPSSGLPEDLVVDFEILSAMRDAPKGIMPPERWEERMSAFVDSLPETVDPQRDRVKEGKWRRRLRFVAAAASIVAVSTAAIYFALGEGAGKTPPVSDIGNLTAVNVDSVSGPSGITVEEPKVVLAQTVDMEKESVKPKRKRSLRRKAAPTVEEVVEVDEFENCYLEITDPKDAARVAARLLSSLDAHLGRATAKVEEAEWLLATTTFDANVMSEKLSRYME